MLVDRQEDTLDRKALKSRLLCPVCGEKLSWDKNPIVSEQGFIYRKRICLSCNATVRTKQGAEEVTHVEICIENMKQ